MPSVLITGPSRWRDPGEEAALAALLRGLHGWDPIVASAEASAAAAPGGADVVDAASPRQLGRALVRADAVIATSRVLGLDAEGGNGRAASTLLRTAGLLGAARWLGKPAAMIGVGSGRLSTRGSRALARAVVHRADLLVLRDGASARELGEAGAPVPFRVGADLAWSALADGPSPGAAAAAARLAAGNGHAPTNGRPNPGGSITVALDHRGARVELVQRLALALGRIAAAGIEVRLQPWISRRQGFDDVRLAGVLAGMIDGPVMVLPAPTSFRAAAEDLKRSGAVVALRYRALVAAAAASAPCLAVVHEPDVGDLAARLGQPRISASANPPELVDAIVGALDHAPPERAAVDAQVDSAAESVRLLRLLLSDGDSPDVNELDGLSLEPTAVA